MFATDGYIMVLLFLGKTLQSQSRKPFILNQYEKALETFSWITVRQTFDLPPMATLARLLFEELTELWLSVC